VSNHRKASIPVAPDDIKLAWALADAARPYLSATELSAIHISIGVGETFAAIDVLVTAVARERLPLDDELVGTVTAWLDCYVGQDAEPRLRELLADVRAVVDSGAASSDGLRANPPLAGSASA
jgi:hypothetical protein